MIVPFSHEYNCCGRRACFECISIKPRFADYCPHCQHTGALEKLNRQQGQARSRPDSYGTSSQEPTIYNHLCTRDPEKLDEAVEDVLHFVDANNDTIEILSIRYGVPVESLKRKNNLFANHLLAGRRTILIPGEFYRGGVSLSPRPIGGEEEEIKKGKVRKWQVACKVAEYVLSLLSTTRIAKKKKKKH